MPSIEERFSAAMHNTTRTWRQAVDRRLRQKGVGVSQSGWLTIATIAKADHPLSQTELANRMCVEDPSIVCMLDRLDKAGLVTRVPSETDRRVKHVMLTQSGQALYAEVKTVADEFRQEVLGDIDPDTLRTATELLEALQKVAEACE